MERFYLEPPEDLESLLMERSSLFETLRVDQGRVCRLDLHLDRLRASAKALGLCYAKDNEGWLENGLHLPAEGTYRLKLMLDAGGDLFAVLRPYRLPSGPIHLVTEGWTPPEGAGHKATERGPYRQARERAQSMGMSDVLFFDAHGRLLETSIANLFLLIDGKLWTPPVDLGVLPGTVRRALVERGRAVEKVLTISDLEDAEAVFLTNSLMRIAPVVAIDEKRYRADHPLGERIARELIEMRF